MISNFGAKPNVHCTKVLNTNKLQKQSIIIINIINNLGIQNEPIKAFATRKSIWLAFLESCLMLDDANYHDDDSETDAVMDYDEDDLSDNDDNGESRHGQFRARLEIKSCQFIDLSALGKICNTGRKIKYFKVIKS